MSSMPPPPPAFAAAGPGFARRADANAPDPDLGVIETNDEASGAKACCASRGYFDDPFVKHFARRVPKHPPLINRGYHARVATVRAVLDAFLDATFDADRAENHLGATAPATSRPTSGARIAKARGKKRQIVSLGAGFDTSYFRLRARERVDDHERHLMFVEIDHPSVMRTKAAIVNATAATRAACVGGEGVRRLVPPSSSVVDAFDDGGGYAMRGCDLRDTNSLDAALDSVVGLDPTAPTLFLAECCLAYLEAEQAEATLGWAARWGGASSRSGDADDTNQSPTTHALRAYFAYDPTLTADTSADAFGAQMVLNLKARGCPLLGAESVLGVGAHASRARRNGWTRAGAADMLAASARLATEDAKEARRVAFLEPLDELEEYRLIQKHYVVSWGVRGGNESDAARLERVVDRK